VFDGLVVAVHRRSSTCSENCDRGRSRHFAGEGVHSEPDLLRSGPHHSDLSVLERVRADGSSGLSGRTVGSAATVFAVCRSKRRHSAQLTACLSVLLCDEFRCDCALFVLSLSTVAHTLGRTATGAFRRPERTDSSTESLSHHGTQFGAGSSITTRCVPTVRRTTLVRQDLRTERLFDQRFATESGQTSACGHVLEVIACTSVRSPFDSAFLFNLIARLS
jgi:hypothetical protein